jgi:hypothetical protein
MDETVKRLVERFSLEPHPEGGYFREVYRSPYRVEHPGVPEDQARGRLAGTLIYFLLAGSEFSAFHRVKWTDEIWHLYAGGPIELHVIDANGKYSRRDLSSDLERGEPTAVVKAGEWQAARLAPGVPWALGGCGVTPGFDYADFDMPPAHELLAAYPEHAAIIKALTR